MSLPPSWRPNAQWRGHMPKRFEVTSSNCNGIIVPFKVGRRLVLEVTTRDGEYWAHGCAAGVVDGVSTSAFQDGHAWASALGGLDSPPAFVGDGDSGVRVAPLLLFVTPFAAIALLDACDAASLAMNEATTTTTRREPCSAEIRSELNPTRSDMVLWRASTLRAWESSPNLYLCSEAA
jgi:hypothetical protein